MSRVTTWLTDLGVARPLSGSQTRYESHYNAWSHQCNGCVQEVQCHHYTALSNLCIVVCCTVDFGGNATHCQAQDQRA
jgi:predicted oxidoreductase (fatty acid repression mutant protein)